MLVHKVGAKGLDTCCICYKLGEILMPQVDLNYSLIEITQVQ